mgnify:CR=1 FL=1
MEKFGRCFKCDSAIYLICQTCLQEQGLPNVIKSANNTQQLKTEILRYANEGINLCFDTDCDERIATRFEKIIEKLLAI